MDWHHPVFPCFQVATDSDRSLLTLASNGNLFIPNVYAKTFGPCVYYFSCPAVLNTLRQIKMTHLQYLASLDM